MCVSMLKCPQSLAGERLLPRAVLSPMSQWDKYTKPQCKNRHFIDRMSQAHKFTGRKNGTQSYKKEMVFQVSLETGISSLLKKSKLRNKNTIMEMWGKNTSK